MLGRSIEVSHGPIGARGNRREARERIRTRGRSRNSAGVASPRVEVPKIQRRGDAGLLQESAEVSDVRSSLTEISRRCREGKRRARGILVKEEHKEPQYFIAI